MKLKILYLLVSAIISYNINSSKRTHEQIEESSSIQTNATNNQAIDFTSNQNLPYEMTKQIYKSTIDQILLDCENTQDFINAIDNVNKVRAVNIKSKEILDQIISSIKSRLDNLDFDENNLELDYRYVLYFMIKDQKLSDEVIYDYDIDSFPKESIYPYWQAIYNIDYVLEIYQNKKNEEIVDPVSDEGLEQLLYCPILIYALKNNNYKIAELLIRMGCDVNVQRKNGNSYTYLIDDFKGDPKIVRKLCNLLLNKGIKIMRDCDYDYIYIYPSYII